MTFLAIGTYTETLPHVAGKGAGIYSGHFDEGTGRLSAIRAAANSTNPSYLAYCAQRQTLYAVQETSQAETSAVAAFRVESSTGALHFLNEQPAQGAAPCHVSVVGTGQFVLAANYGSGNVVVLPAADGRLQPASYVFQHPGPEPHAHMIVPDPGSRFVLALDLGVDALFTYRLDSTSGVLMLHGETKMPTGSGPRHLAFHVSGHALFVVHEVASLVTTWAYADGRLSHRHTISTLPDGFTGRNAPSAIRVSADGRFVYAANRWHDTIAVFALDELSFTLSLVAHISVHGRTPRDFILDRTGRFLLVANQDSDNVCIFRLDPQTGLPLEEVQSVPVPTPVCLQFMGE